MRSDSLAVDRAPLIVALDAGTSSVRALVFDSLGRAIVDTDEQLPYALDTTSDGGATFPADALFDHAAPHIFLARVFLFRIGVAAIHHHHGTQIMFHQRGFGVSDAGGVVIRPGPAPA